jgi:hypothetical protein
MSRQAFIEQFVSLLLECLREESCLEHFLSSDNGYAELAQIACYNPLILDEMVFIPLQSDLDSWDGHVRDDTRTVGGGSESTGTTPAPKPKGQGLSRV